MQRWLDLHRTTVVGGLVNGRVLHISKYNSLEHRRGRIHMILDRRRAAFVFGARYAPDAVKTCILPERREREADLSARSGIDGFMRMKFNVVNDPAKIEIFGYVVDREGHRLNTRDPRRNAPQANPARPTARQDEPKCRHNHQLGENHLLHRLLQAAVEHVFRRARQLGDGIGEPEGLPPHAGRRIGGGFRIHRDRLFLDLPP